ncbi:hypothetical protein Bca4012_038957 [Brassica carinata]
MNVSEPPDPGPVDTQANKRSKTLTHEPEENSSCLIPCDLIIEIFSRLPAKSIARFRCLTKRWASLLRLPYFTELFLTKSSTRPRLLFFCEKDGHLFFFSSSPQPQSSSLLTTSCYHMKVPYQSFGYSFDVRFSCVKGLVLLRFERVLNGHGHVSVICNPSAGQSLILPKVKTRRKIGVRSYLGYDPVEKQYKVLSMTWLFHGSQRLVSDEHQVLTLGGKPPSWRKIECSVPYTINYKYHHEKFSFVKDTDGYTQLFGCAVLKNYNDKLVSLGPETINISCKSIRLRVLEDVEKEEWSQHIYMLPDLWREIVGKAFLSFVGVTRRKEIVFLSSFFHRYLLYFDTERYTVVRVGIQGIEAVKHSHMFVFVDHVEDVKLIEVF